MSSHQIKPLKILHILNELNYSGAEVMLKQSAPFFIERRAQLYCLSTGKSAGVYAPVLGDAGYRVFCIQFAKSLHYAYAVYSFLRQHRLSVVHIHAEHGFLLHAFLARLAGCKKIIRTVHSSFPFSGFLRIRKLIERKVAKELFGVFFVSISPSVHENEYLKFANQSLLIMNWIDISIFHPACDIGEKQRLRKKYAIGSNNLVLTSVGSCIDIKNHMDVIIAMNLITIEYPYVFYIHVGTGPLEQDERSLVEELGLNERVYWTGYCDNPRDLLVLSDIFVMPSTYEGLAVACMEAMSCGLPALVYDVPGLRDLVQSGENGLCVQPNPQALAKGLVKICENKQKMRIMGKAGHDRILKFCNKENSLTMLYKIYST